MSTLSRFAALAALTVSTLAAGQAYPSKPITIYSATSAGGAIDVLARTMGEIMSKALGQPIIVDNKPGASGTLAVQQLLHAPADGYTLLFSASTPISYAPYTFSKLSYDVRRDLAFVTHVADASLVLAVNKDVPASNLKEFLAWAEQNKGKVTYGTYGIGTAGHLVSSFISKEYKLDMPDVPYKGEAPLLQDLIGGQVSWALATAGSMRPYFIGGRIRPLAVLTAQRLVDLPDVPTMVELGFNQPEYKIIGGVELMARAGTPAAVLARLEKEARAAIQSTAMKARLQVYGMTGVGDSSEDARRQFEASGPVIEKLVKASGARLD